MNKQVVVLTPMEWDNRMSFSTALTRLDNHLHFACTKQANIDAIIMSLKRRISELPSGIATDVITSMLSEVLDASREMVKEIQEGRRYTSEVEKTIVALNLRG